MSSWGARRRNRIISIFLLIVGAIVILIFLNLISSDPTCFDGRRNGDEQGRDCGGSCDLLCEGQAIKPLVHWSRSFQVAPGIYNAVAYLENLNTEAGSDRLDYTFTAYNSDNVLVAQRSGSIKLRPREVIPVVENSINVGKQEISRTTFSMDNMIIWNSQEPRDRVIVVGDERLFEVDSLPRISADVTNISIDTLEDLELIVIIYDASGNAINTSSTIIESISKDEKREIIYTWPRPFSKDVQRFEIIPLYELSS